MKIIADDAIPYAPELFADLGELIQIPGRSITAHDVKDADALLIRSRTQINEDLLKDSNVQFVGSTVVGLDHVDQSYLKAAGIHFYSAQGCNANSVAEYVIAAMMEHALEFDYSLKGKSIGIIGVGHVGSLVEQKAKALGLQCLLNDPPRARNEGDESFVDVDTVLTADFITIHTPLIRDGEDCTLNLLSAEKLKALKPHQILINAARGDVLDEQALIPTNLKAKIIDCWQNEPNINEALFEQCYIATPHIAGHSLEAKANGTQWVYEQLCHFFDLPRNKHIDEYLPPISEYFSLENSHSESELFGQILQTYRPSQDHAVLKKQQISSIFEHYRRHYPIHREWSKIMKKSNNFKDLISPQKIR